MGIGVSISLAILGVIAGTLGLIILGWPAIMLALLLFGASIIALAIEMDARVSQPLPRGENWVCSSCGGVLHGPEAECPH